MMLRKNKKHTSNKVILKHMQWKNCVHSRYRSKQQKKIIVLQNEKKDETNVKKIFESLSK